MNIRDVLLEQKIELDEVMNRKDLINREVQDKFKSIRESSLSKIITGIRRAGKSTLLYLLLKNIDYGYINFDDINLYGIEAPDIFNNFIELYGNVRNVFLDEVQNLKNWELFVNNLQTSYNVFITGSNSNLLSSELSSHLTGRHIQLELFPLSFREYSLFKDNLNFATIRKQNLIKNNLKFYLDNGGFPEIVIGNEIRNVYLTRLYTDIIEKDIIMRHDINQKKTFIDIANFIMNSFTGYISYNKLTNNFSVGSVHTVKNYLNYLAESYLVFFLDKYSYKEIEIQKSIKKAYIVDNGFINILNRNSLDVGKSLENAVAIDLKRRSFNENFNIYYWKDYSDYEVDFVIKKDIDFKALIQVTYALDEKDINTREIRALLKASDALKCYNLIVITWNYSAITTYEKKKINFIPAWQWFLETDMNQLYHHREI